MRNKKIIFSCLVLTLLTLTAGQVLAEDSASPSGKSNDDVKKMVLLRPTMKVALGKLRPTMGMQEMENKMRQLEQKSRLRQQNFRFRLSKLKDEKKKTVLLNLDTKMSSMSGRATTAMSDAITRMTNVLTKVEEKAVLAKAQGVDTANLDSAIIEAKAALASASAAVSTQETKVYNIPVTNDDEAKTNAGQIISTFRSDLSKTHQSVMQAKQAMMKVLMELRKIWQDIKPTATATETPSPTSQVTPTATMTTEEMQQMEQ